jgi:hypothetical protein
VVIYPTVAFVMSLFGVESGGEMVLVRVAAA